MYAGAFLLVMAVMPGFLGVMWFIADLGNFKRRAAWRVGQPGTLTNSSLTRRPAEVVVVAHG